LPDATFTISAAQTGVLLTRRPRAARKEKAMLVSWVLSKIRNYLNYRETVAELSRLTDRELDDLGISRYDIESVARQGR
jgi:uncharacterized protein YjiS (DUF1127 family)